MPLVKKWIELYIVHASINDLIISREVFITLRLRLLVTIGFPHIPGGAQKWTLIDFNEKILLMMNYDGLSQTVSHRCRISGVTPQLFILWCLLKGYYNPVLRLPIDKKSILQWKMANRSGIVSICYVHQNSRKAKKW